MAPSSQSQNPIKPTILLCTTNAKIVVTAESPSSTHNYKSGNFYKLSKVYTPVNLFNISNRIADT